MDVAKVWSISSCTTNHCTLTSSNLAALFSAHLFFADASHAQMPFSFLDTWHSKIDLNLDMKF